ncbi:hypothetical protein RIF23_05065 [Lipingzhangella sp. LS1_29]|uniref:ACT domain-containing protein n=1 Tax=Lipingzhangella rawalii TaxID=2055835 RepID=A0ABU2H4W8_9ACTN|nr:hypothetical protein [Lipingzhangella rawalii]MDS1269659.1 hypothetical protein [Lipingzhangella rawalii]
MGDKQRDHHGAEHQAGLRRELLELAAIFCAGGAAHFVVLSLGHREYGGVALVAIGAALLGGLLGYRWWRDRRAGTQRDPQSGDALWRIRVGVADVPGGLAALTARLTRIGVDIRVVHVHQGYREAVDEFVVTCPPGICAPDLRTAVAQAGGRDPVVEPADAHHLSDTTTRALGLASALLSTRTSLEDALTSMSGARRAVWQPEPPTYLQRDEMAGTSMCLSAPDGGVLVLEREGLPFTPAEYARCTALVRLATASGARTPEQQPRTPALGWRDSPVE